MPLVLIVEDEKDIVELIKYNLERSAFKTLAAYSGEEALKCAKDKQPDLIILDIMLPGIDGFEVCKTLRSQPETAHIPIIMLTARREEIDKILGLELGSDDYMTKPFSPRELVARAKAMLRRKVSGEAETVALEAGELILDPIRREVRWRDKPIELTAKEFDLVEYFLKNRGKALSREVLLNHVWGYDYYGTTRTLDVHVQRVREKLKGSGDLIQTVRGIGYKLRDEI